MRELTLFQLNDSHAYVEEHWEAFLGPGGKEYRRVGGFSRMASVVNEAREIKENVLFLDCGDTLHGTRAAVEGRGEGMVPVLNAMGIDAMTCHWEFAYGPRQVRRLCDMLRHPMLAINIFREDDDSLFLEPYRTFPLEDIVVGVVGIACPIVDKVMPPSFSKGLYFTLGNEELPYYVEELSPKVDILIVLSHLGLPQEMRLLREVSGVDVLLSGHTHHRLRSPVRGGDTVVMQSGSHGSFLGRLDLTVSDDGVLSFDHMLMEMSPDIPRDPVVQGEVDDLLDPYREGMRERVGGTSTGLDRMGILESTMDDLLLEAMLDATGAEVALSNGWRYGAPIPPGDITLDELWNMVPVDPVIGLAEVRGDELVPLMEENLERTFSSDPYRQMGGFLKRSMGMRMYFKLDDPEGMRVKRLYVGGEAVDPERVYRVAFLTQQALPEGMGRRTGDGPRAMDALRALLAKGEVSIVPRCDMIPI